MAIMAYRETRRELNGLSDIARRGRGELMRWKARMWLVYAIYSFFGGSLEGLFLGGISRHVNVEGEGGAGGSAGTLLQSLAIAGAMTFVLVGLWHCAFVWFCALPTIALPRGSFLRRHAGHIKRVVAINCWLPGLAGVAIFVPVLAGAKPGTIYDFDTVSLLLTALSLLVFLATLFWISYYLHASIAQSLAREKQDGDRAARMRKARKNVRTVVLLLVLLGPGALLFLLLVSFHPFFRTRTYVFINLCGLAANGWHLIILFVWRYQAKLHAWLEARRQRREQRRASRQSSGGGGPSTVTSVAATFSRTPLFSPLPCRFSRPPLSLRTRT